MKYLITESSFKNILFRYWNKVGGTIDDIFFKFLGLNKKDSSHINKYLIEWRGEDETKNLTKKLLLNKPHTVTNGENNILFYVTNIKEWRLNDTSPSVIIDLEINYLDSTVIPPNNVEPISLTDAFFEGDEDYLFYLEGEIDWEIHEYFKKHITQYTGLLVLSNPPFKM